MLSSLEPVSVHRSIGPSVPFPDLASTVVPIMSLSGILMEKWFPPPECTTSFEGKTVLITGANTGIGLEAAKRVTRLNAKRLIITTRSHLKGEHAKEEIQRSLATSGPPNSQTEILPMILDLGTADGVKTFVQQLGQATEKLDAALLNAGMITPRHSITVEGFEEMLQVNTVSTIFLATLILPIMISTSESTRNPTHLTLVSSRAAHGATMPPPEVQSSETPIKDLSAETLFPKGPTRSQFRYAQSKLLLELAIRHLSQLSTIKNDDDKPRVIIGSVCPGVCHTNMVQHHDRLSLMSFMWYVLGPIGWRPAWRGADTCLTALTAGEEGNGRMRGVMSYVDDPDVIKGAEGQALGDKAWRELQAVMTGWEPSTKDVLQED